MLRVVRVLRGRGSEDRGSVPYVFALCLKVRWTTNMRILPRWHRTRT